MTATIPLCPECGDPVDKHDAFFCEVIGCKCNNSKKTAMALYERDYYKNLYEESQRLYKELKKIAVDAAFGT